MRLFRKILTLVLSPTILQKILAYLLLMWFFWLFHNFLLIFFLTFIFGYLFFIFWRFLKLKIDLWLTKIISNKKKLDWYKKLFSLNGIVFFLYLFFVGFSLYTAFDLPPKLLRELTLIPQQIPFLTEPVSLVTTKLEQIKNINSQIWQDINNIFTKQDIELALKLFEKIKAFWLLFFKVFVSLILSYIFIIDREKLKKYLDTVKNSHFWFLHREYKSLIEKIVKTFWTSFKAQSFIAGINATLTTLWLMLIWFVNFWHPFPFVYTLTLIIFICWFIPFLGLFISSIPIILIGFTMIWGWMVVLQIIFLIVLVHLFEAYYLNPKIVSSLIHLPISLTFVVLLVSEHFFGFAWLIIGVGLFYLFIEILKDTNQMISIFLKKMKEMDGVTELTKHTIQKDLRMSRSIVEK